MKCHSYDDFGGSAGPRLNGVADRLTREQLLEALINPSGRIAPGFGVVSLEMEGGKTLSGILQDENDTELILKVGNKPDTVIMKDNVVKQTSAPSSMPDMKNFLSKKEIRDLVSFLTTLHGDEMQASAAE